MTDGFKNHSTYLVAFLAVLVGLSAFKDVIAGWPSFLLFGFDVSWIFVSGVMLLGLVLTAYLSALTFLVEYVNFTLFPLKKYLQVAASSLAAISLGIPLLLPLLLLVSNIASLVVGLFSSLNLATVNNVLIVVSGLSLLVATVSTGRYINQVRYEKERANFEKTIEKTIALLKSVKTRDTREDLSQDFLVKYEALLSTMARVLNLKGYGVGVNRNIEYLARVLADKGVLVKADVELAHQVRMVRNRLAHGDKTLVKQNIIDASWSVTSLIRKVDQAFASNSGEE